MCVCIFTPLQLIISIQFILYFVSLCVFIIEHIPFLHKVYWQFLYCTLPFFCRVNFMWWLFIFPYPLNFTSLSRVIVYWRHLLISRSSWESFKSSNSTQFYFFMCEILQDLCMGEIQVESSLWKIFTLSINLNVG